MTLKDAVIRSLDELKEPVIYSQVHKHIVAKSYYNFKGAQTPAQTVSAVLGNFIRNRDSRVKRIPLKGAAFAYYLAKYEADISITSLEAFGQDGEKEGASGVAEPVAEYHQYFDERSLHKLLSSYLNGIGIRSKTVFHEQSNSKDNHQKWIHPDMVGIRFLKLQTQVGQALFKAISPTGSFELSAYELKKEIRSDYDLKKYFFQAVSNSSFANYGFLVAFKINDVLMNEMKRLSQSFGIGIIRLAANPFQSEMLFPAKYRELDFVTIDKLCKINQNFEHFISHTEKLLAADERYVNALERELTGFCDDFFTSEEDAESYCKVKSIPVEKTYGDGIEEE